MKGALVLLNTLFFSTNLISQESRYRDSLVRVIDLWKNPIEICDTFYSPHENNYRIICSQVFQDSTIKDVFKMVRTETITQLQTHETIIAHTFYFKNRKPLKAISFEKYPNNKTEEFYYSANDIKEISQKEKLRKEALDFINRIQIVSQSNQDSIKLFIDSERVSTALNQRTRYPGKVTTYQKDGFLIKIKLVNESLTPIKIIAGTTNSEFECEMGAVNMHLEKLKDFCFQKTGPDCDPIYNPNPPTPKYTTLGFKDTISYNFDISGFFDGKILGNGDFEFSGKFRIKVRHYYYSLKGKRSLIESDWLYVIFPD